ncbi:hypothetical protein [Streptomyces sp. NPDC058657]|uniref:hypothetical protein n=1 Tax=unclassified Streptomyces TaxID=2593676 RepID=UPI00364950C7
MVATIPLVLLFGVLLAVILRASRGGYILALVATLFGFFLAATGAAGPVNQAIRTFFDVLSQ